MPDDVRDLLVRELDLGPSDVYESTAPSTSAACGRCTASTGPT